MVRVLTMGGVIPHSTNKPTWLYDTKQTLVLYVTLDADTLLRLFNTYVFEGDILVPVVLIIREDGRVDPIGMYAVHGGIVEILPPVREETEEIPGRDGEWDFGASLAARGMELRLVSENGLTAAQREEIKRFLAYRLDPRKGAVRIIWERHPDRYIDMRLTGTVETEEYLDGMQVVMSLKATTPFYIGVERHAFVGSGVLTTNGNTETPCRVLIQGPVTNPTVTIGEQSFTWQGTVGSTDLLVVDTDRLTVTFNGINAMSGFSGDFPVLKPGDNEVVAPREGATTILWRDRWV